MLPAALSLVRKLCSHIEIHAKARGKLSALHKVLSGEFSGGAAGLTYAPHRFLSHAGAASALSKSYVEVLLYVHAATREVDKAVQGWAARMLEITQHLRTWLTLSAIADILQILRAANVRMQRGELRVLMVNDIVEACEVKLDDYVKEGGVLQAALLELGKVSAEPEGGWDIQAVCRRVQLVKKHGQLHARTLLSPLGAGYLRLSADATTLVDVVKVAGEAVGIVKADLCRRFANTGVWRFAYVLDPEWDDPPQQQAAALGSPRAMQGWAEHISVSGAVLQVEWAHLHACRVAHLKSNPQRRTLPPHEFWPELLRTEASTVPVLMRCMCALLVVAFQNASVERDLSVLKLVSERACGQLGMERLSARCRAAIDGPVAEKKRGVKLDGMLLAFAQEWGARAQRRVRGARAGPLQPQGRMPQRARRGGESALVREMSADVGRMASGGGSRGCGRCECSSTVEHERLGSVQPALQIRRYEPQKPDTTKCTHRLCHRYDRASQA